MGLVSMFVIPASAPIPYKPLIFNGFFGFWGFATSPCYKVRCLMDGLFRRGGIWSARLVVPPRLRGRAGRREFIQSALPEDSHAAVTQTHPPRSFNDRVGVLWCSHVATSSCTGLYAVQFSGSTRLLKGRSSHQCLALSIH